MNNSRPAAADRSPQAKNATTFDLIRLFWNVLKRLWFRWTDVLVIVTPEIVTGWHRAGLRLYRRWHSHPGSGRPKIGDEMRVLIRRLPEE
jgi:hypothetical protein